MNEASKDVFLPFFLPLHDNLTNVWCMANTGKTSETKTDRIG